MTEAVLFDYGLTLVDFAFPRQELLGVLEGFRARMQAELGRTAPSAEELVSLVLEPIEEALAGFGEDEVTDYLTFYRSGWRRAGLDLSSDLLYQILDQEQLCWDRAVRVAPEAPAILDRLRALGVRTAIASNAPFPPPMMRRQMAASGLAARVDAIVLSSEVGRRKPAPELYRVALDRLDVAPDRALYVGDRVREDFQGPLAVGMRAVICTGLSRRPPPDGVPTIPSLDQVESLL